MKVGIVTFHCSNNYGAALQAIALTEKLNEMGHEAKIIDYRPHYKTDAYKPFKIIRKYNSFKHFLYNLSSIPLKYKMDREFQRFNTKNMKIWGQTYYTSEEIIKNPPEIDAVITGSDQVWNPESLGAVDKTYFLGFGPKNVKRISYAPSFGTSKVDKRFWNEMSTYIENMDAVSVREIEGKELVKEMTGREATHVLDPVFLLDKDKWDEFSDDVTSIDEPYLLIYARERSKLLSDVAYKIAREKNLKIINISKIMIGLNKYDKNIFSIGPGKFLELFKNASAICTNSFHGTAFAIIFNKPFLVVPHTTRNTRIDSILKTLDLSSQSITDISQLDQKSIQEMIHYDSEKVKQLLDEERKKSINFLECALENNKNEQGETL